MEMIREDILFAVRVALHPHFGKQRPAIILYARPVLLPVWGAP